MGTAEVETILRSVWLPVIGDPSMFMMGRKPKGAKVFAIAINPCQGYRLWRAPPHPSVISSRPSAGQVRTLLLVRDLERNNLTAKLRGEARCLPRRGLGRTLLIRPCIHPSTVFFLLTGLFCQVRGPLHQDHVLDDDVAGLANGRVIPRKHAVRTCAPALRLLEMGLPMVGLAQHLVVIPLE